MTASRRFETPVSAQVPHRTPCTTSRWVLAGLALIASATSADVRADVDVEVGNGAIVAGTLDPATEAENIRVFIPAESLLTVKAKGTKPRGTRYPPDIVFLVEDASGNDVSQGQIVTGAKGTKLKKVPIERSGFYVVKVRSADGKIPGDYDLSVKWAPRAKTKDELDLSSGSDTVVVSGDRGATAKLTAKADRGSAAQPRILSVTDPLGNEIPNLVTKPKGGKDTATITLDLPGDHVVTVGNDGGAGGASLSVKFKKAKAPKVRVPLDDDALSVAEGDESAIGAVIGRQGGTVDSADFDVPGVLGPSISIPTGALSAPVVIVIASADDIPTPSPQLAPVGDAFRFGPDGLEFQGTASLTLPFNPDEIVGDLSEIRVVRETSGGSRSVLDPPYDIDTAGLVTFPVSGFSRYQVFAPPPPPPNPTQSNALTLQGVKRLLEGDDDFTSIGATFENARVADFTNEAPRFFAAFTEVLAFLDAQSSAGGAGRVLAERTGIEFVPVTSFWDTTTLLEVHGQGDVKDGAPTSTEGRAWIDDDLVPAFERFLARTRTISPEFEYRLTTVDSGEVFFDGDLGDDSESVWIDYAEVQLLRGIAEYALAMHDVAGAYDDAGVDPNDLDDGSDDEFGNDGNMDRMAVAVDTYTTFGNLIAASRFQDAREHLRNAVAAFDALSDHVVTEDADQRVGGLIAPYRSDLRGRPMFPSATSPGEVVGNSIGAEVFLDDVLASIDGTGAKDVLFEGDGRGVPADRRHRVDLNALFRDGFDVRSLLFKTIVDPRTGRRRLGVDDVSDLSETASLDGLVERVFGTQPDEWDARGGEASHYGLLVDSPATHTKTVDGNLADWTIGTNATLVGRAGAALTEGSIPLRAGQADVMVSKDADNLYVAIRGRPNEDLFAYDVIVSDAEESAAVFGGHVPFTKSRPSLRFAGGLPPYLGPTRFGEPPYWTDPDEPYWWEFADLGTWAPSPSALQPPWWSGTVTFTATQGVAFVAPSFGDPLINFNVVPTDGTVDLSTMEVLASQIAGEATIVTRARFDFSQWRTLASIAEQTALPDAAVGPFQRSLFVVPTTDTTRVEDRPIAAVGAQGIEFCFPLRNVDGSRVRLQVRQRVLLESADRFFGLRDQLIADWPSLAFFRRQFRLAEVASAKPELTRIDHEDIFIRID